LKKAFNTADYQLQGEADVTDRAFVVAFEEVGKLLKQGGSQRSIQTIALDFPILESFKAQMALVEIVQKSGHYKIIEKIICNDMETGEVSKHIGLEAFEETLHDKSFPLEDLSKIVSSLTFSLEKAQKTWSSLETKLKDIKSKQVIPIA